MPWGERKILPIPPRSNYTLGKGAFLCPFPPHLCPQLQVAEAVAGLGHPMAVGLSPLRRAGSLPAAGQGRAKACREPGKAPGRTESSPGPCSQRSLCFRLSLL